MLQAVVADHDIAFRITCQQRQARRHPLATHEHGTLGATPDQQRLVAHLAGRTLRLDFAYTCGAAAIAATDDTRMPPALAHGFDQPQYQRRFAGSTGGDIADHHHRHRQAHDREDAEAVQKPPQRRHCSKQECHGQQQPGAQVPAAPDQISAALAGWQRKCARDRPAGRPA